MYTPNKILRETSESDLDREVIQIKEKIDQVVSSTQYYPRPIQIATFFYIKSLSNRAGVNHKPMYNYYKRSVRMAQNF